MAEHVFTDDEIRQIIDVINRTKHTQYIGARYVPVFGRVNEDSIEWDNGAPYEPLTIVLYQGNSYTSRQYVPAGVEITNEQYWANTGNYNAQVEQYRKEVRSFDGRITANETAITGVNDILSTLGASDAELASALAKTIDDTKKLSGTNASKIARNGADIASINNRFDDSKIINFLNEKRITPQTPDDDVLDAILSSPNIGGKTLYFPAGTYAFTRRHTLPDSLKIIGQGAAKTRIIWDSVDDGEIGSGPFYIAQGDGFEFSDMAFTATAPMPDISNRTIQRYNFYLIMIAQNSVKNVYIHDIKVEKYQLIECGVPHISTDKPNENITIARITAGHWTNKTAGKHDITSAVIELYNTNNFRVTDCVLINKNYWGGGCGIQCWGGSSIDKDTFRGGGTWLNNFSIDHNIISHTQWSPIYTACAANGYITDNICYDCGDGCLSIEGAKNVVISGNVLSDSNNYCIAAANALCNVIISNNILTQSGETGRIGDQTQDGTMPRRRYRMIVRWGVMVSGDTSQYQSLTVANNVMKYYGDSAVKQEGQSVGVIELGNDSGSLLFEGNSMINTALSTFQKLITGNWGIASFQVRYSKPCPTKIINNTFIFDDADERVAGDGNPFGGVCMYVSNPFAAVTEIRGNRVRSEKYAVKAAPIRVRNIYVAVVAGTDNYDGELQKNAGTILIDGNHLEKFKNILKCSTYSSHNDANFFFRNNMIITASDWAIIKDATQGNISLFVQNNVKQLYNSDTEQLQYWEPLITAIPKKGTDLYSMIATGSRLDFIYEQTLGDKKYLTIQKRQTGWQGIGEAGTVVTEF